MGDTLPSSAEWEILDEEANIFACFLLMPAPLFDRDAKNLDMTDDNAVAKLARKYRVPIGVIGYRIALGRRPASRSRRLAEETLSERRSRR